MWYVAFVILLMALPVTFSDESEEKLLGLCRVGCKNLNSVSQSVQILSFTNDLQIGIHLSYAWYRRVPVDALACWPACVCCCQASATVASLVMRCEVDEIRRRRRSVLQRKCCCCVNSSSALLKVVQLRLPDIEKTYLDLVLQHRARYKQRCVTR